MEDTGVVEIKEYLGGYQHEEGKQLFVEKV